MIQQRFKCVVCKKDLIYLGEGTTNVPTGFALRGDSHVCYNCDASMVAQEMTSYGKVRLHLGVSVEFGWYLHTFPATLQFQLLGESLDTQLQVRTLKIGKNESTEISMASFIGHDNLLWVATGQNLKAGVNDKMFCARAKDQPKNIYNAHSGSRDFKMFKPFTGYQNG